MLILKKIDCPAFLRALVGGILGFLWAFSITFFIYCHFIAATVDWRHMFMVLNSYLISLPPLGMVVGIMTSYPNRLSLFLKVLLILVTGFFGLLLLGIACWGDYEFAMTLLLSMCSLIPAAGIGWRLRSDRCSFGNRKDDNVIDMIEAGSLLQNEKESNNPTGRKNPL